MNIPIPPPNFKEPPPKFIPSVPPPPVPGTYPVIIPSVPPPPVPGTYSALTTQSFEPQNQQQNIPIYPPYSRPPPSYPTHHSIPPTSAAPSTYSSSYPPPPIINAQSPLIPKYRYPVQSYRPTYPSIPPPRKTFPYSDHSNSSRPTSYSQTKTTRYSSSSTAPTTYESQNYSNYKHEIHTNSSKSNSSNDSKFYKYSDEKEETERERLLKTWRSQYCETSEEITKKLNELADYNDDNKEYWIRSSPAEIYYRRTNNGNEIESTQRCDILCQLFEDELVDRAEKIRSTLEPYIPPPRKRKHRVCKHKSEQCSSSDSSDDDFEPEEDCSMEELSRKIQHKYRLHPDLWHNESGEMNDGPLCRCSAKSRKIGIRHGMYPGEVGYPKCKLNSNNADKLYHYRITISPPTNFLTKTPTIIEYDKHEFIFEGFSLLSHQPIEELPTCKVIRFNIEYTILYVEEKMPENFTIRELDSFFKYLFHELLELIDFNVLPSRNIDDSCSCFHFLPRFVRDLDDNGKEVLSMSEVMRYLLDSSGPLIDPLTLARMNDLEQYEWQHYVDFLKGMVVTNPSQRPCSVRVDQIDRNTSDLPQSSIPDENGFLHPAIVHFGIRPPQLSAGNPEYQKAWKEYVKFRHLVANMSKPSYDDKRKLEAKEKRLHEMRTHGRIMRNLTVAISSKGFYRTGIMCDIVQHAMLIPVLTGHLRFHQSLNLLEKTIEYKFKNRYLLQLALTHPSYKENFGTNPDHARNSLTNCGIRQPEYGDRKIHYMNTRKRGINTLINIMSRFGKEYETDSNITHNERLEFLGDAVVEFLSSIHLFFMFPDLEEGGLATYRAAIVQNQHLAVLARKLHLEEYMLYAHGSDLCHELELRHAMANCFEALMGALLLDGGITIADKVFANALYMDDLVMKEVWENYPPHPLQEQEPLGDRQWIESYQLLKDLTKFEESIGVQFKNIRLLARAFTDRSIGFTHLTLGSNQRLEFLGDTVLQLICSEFLYRHFPEHHEGHLSLLRSSLVNNRTQAVVCDDLGMTKYAVYSNPKAELKTKDRADLLEAFLGALYVDKGLEYSETFCHVCLFPRLQLFIMNQDWNDPKSKLQQCCLTLRTMDGGDPDIPVYKVIDSIGPTNTRVYTVAVYFRGKRLAKSTGHSIQQAEMNAARTALENSRELFPQLDHQKRVIAKSIKRQKGKIGSNNDDKSDMLDENIKMENAYKAMDDSHLPKQYRMQEDISSDELLLDSGGEESINNNNNVSPVKKKRKRKRKKKKNTSIMSLSSISSPTSSIQRRSSLQDSFSPLSDDEIMDLLNDIKNEVDTKEIVQGSTEQLQNEIEIQEICDDNNSREKLTNDICKNFLEGTEELSSPSDIESGEITD